MSEGFSPAHGKLVRQALLVEPFQSLKVLDVTVIRVFVEESSLTVNRRALGNIGGAEDTRVGLGLSAENAALPYISLGKNVSQFTGACLPEKGTGARK